MLILYCRREVIISSNSSCDVSFCSPVNPIAILSTSSTVNVSTDATHLTDTVLLFAQSPLFCVLAEADIHRCYSAVKYAPLHRIHTFLATSDIHLKYKLMISREQCVQRAAAAVKYARTLVDDVEFSPEDSGRSDPDFLCEVCAMLPSFVMPSWLVAQAL